MLAVHVEPFIDVGVIGLRVGPLTSACKSFEIHVRGRSGHTARPFQAIDPIPAACSLTDLFYQLGPRSMDSRYPLALTVASINAGNAFNAIPDHAVMRGTLRTARVEDLQAVEQRMWNVIHGVAQATGCEITMDFAQYAPATNNDARLIDIMNVAARNLLGERGVKWHRCAEPWRRRLRVLPGSRARRNRATGRGHARRARAASRCTRACSTSTSAACRSARSSSRDRPCSPPRRSARE